MFAWLFFKIWPYPIHTTDHDSIVIYSNCFPSYAFLWLNIFVELLDLRPKGRGRPQRILLGVWPDEHIRGVIRAVVFRDSHQIKEEPHMSYQRMHVSILIVYSLSQ